MSVFTSMVTDVLEVPQAPGQSVTIRKLAPKHLDAARRAAQDRALAEMKHLQSMEMGDFLDRVLSEAKAPSVVDPLAAYDRVALMVAGVTAWTFDAPVDRDHVEDLDEDTQDWLARAILRLSKPSLFQTEAEAEADRKNG